MGSRNALVTVLVCLLVLGAGAAWFLSRGSGRGTGRSESTLAAGGPILTPDVQALVLTPICPHTLTNRPLVFPPDARLEIRNASEGSVTLTIDGQWGYEVASGASIEVRRAAQPLRVYRSPRGFFGILREKFRWGERQS